MFNTIDFNKCIEAAKIRMEQRRIALAKREIIANRARAEREIEHFCLNENWLETI